MKRFTLVDGLRGFAAISVVFCHLAIFGLERLSIESPVFKLGYHFLEFGRLGVHIFFVISGFVIAHSLRDTPMSSEGIGRFILRRQARLDPAYWVMILITLMTAGYAMLPAEEGSSPASVPLTPRMAVLNALYLQKISSVPSIVGVSWTLCLEVQFYLLFVLLLFVGCKLSRHKDPVSTKTNALWLVCVLGVISVAATLLTRTPIAEQPWCIQNWQFFACGVLCYWAFGNHNARSALCVMLGSQVVGLLLKIGSLGNGDTPGTIVGIGAVLLLNHARSKGTLERWGDVPLFQYFGRTSYSLYLVHSVVIKMVFNLSIGLLGSGVMTALVGGLASLLISVAAADIFFRYIELPSLLLSKRFKAIGTRQSTHPEPVVDFKVMS